MKRTMSKKRQQRPARGVVLLVVLSLLVLFMVLTVTFVVVTGHYKRTSQSYARLRRTSSQNTGRSLADNVMYQLLRDTRSSSALRNQSLLNDLYGNDGFLGFVVNSQAQGGGQFLEIIAQIDPRNGLYSQINSLVRNGVMPDGCFNGRVLTIVDSVWMPGLDGRWGQAGGPTANDDGFGPANDVREAGYVTGGVSPDDLTIGGRMWTQGNDLQWGRAGTDDDGDGVTDNFPEAGYFNSDDVLIPFTDLGADDRWGRAGIDDDGDGITDNSREANYPGSDDRRVSPVASTRIIKSLWQRNPGNLSQIVGVTLLVETFPDIPVHNQVIPTLAQRFVINGTPFNGTGLGYHPASQGMDLNVPIAPGGDGGWGVAGTDDDKDGATDEQDEAGFPGSDDLAFPIALAQNFSTYRQGTFVGAPLANLATPDFAGWNGLIPNATAGGQDESYDVPDYQNMFLSATVPTAASAADIIPSFHRPELVNYLYNWVVSNLFWNPSGGWWVNPPDHWGMFIAPMGLDGKPGTGDEPPANAGWPAPYRQLVRDLKRWCIFRPLPDEHPNFVSPTDQLQWRGSNSGNSRLINGPYDVDNDGDGILDSVWVDAGLPPVRLPDGRQVKPMVAIQVEDLDNRFDLNATSGLENNVVQDSSNFNFHPGRDGRWGWAGVDDNGDGTVDDFGDRGLPHPTTMAPSDDVRIAGTSNVTGIARGMGIGPAEISLRPLFVDPDNSTATSSSNSSYPGDMLNVINDRYRRVGSATVLPGQYDGSDDELSLVRDFHLPIRYWNTSYAKTSYSSPSDLRGLSATLLDFNGQPIHAYAGMVNEVVDDPYELGIGGDSYRGRTGGDNTYTVNDLERLLRWNDHDVRLVSSRLADLAPDVFTYSSARRLVTTLSSHVPAPNLGVPADLRNLPTAGTNYWKNRLGTAAGNPTPTSAPTIADMFFARFAQGGMALGSFAAQLNVMVPPELQKGQAFDVNRPFGNGRDDDGDGIVDDPYEPIDLALNGIASSTVIRELAWPNPGLANYQFSTVAPTASAFPGRWFNGSNELSVRIDTSVTPNQNYVDALSDPARFQGVPNVRQIYARHLYCMMMMLVDSQFFPPMVDPTTPLPQRQEELARRVAQWAINVVDFRDADSIMTPFEYDAYPFNANGWSVDGVVGLPRIPGPDGLWGTADDTWGASDHILPGPDGLFGTSDDIIVPPNGKADRRVVWGCEAPDLLLTETVALHDRCVKDTDQDNGPAMNKYRGMVGDDVTDDDDLDQFRKPIGSLFLELYCPRNPVRIGPQYGNTVAMPPELYNAAGNLDLTRFAPARLASSPLPGIQHPVWRVAITRRNAPLDDARTAHDPSPTPERLTFTPDEGTDIERMIWFAPLQPTTHPEANLVFYGRSGGVALPPNRYAVIGPRAVTPIGSKDDDGVFTSTSYDFSLPHKDSTHVINLTGGTVSATDNRNPPGGDYTYPVAGTAIQPPVSIICAANAPASWTGVPANYSIGMNVSEPLPQQTNYYPQPLDFPTNSYYGGAGTLSDRPFDEDAANFPNSPLVTGNPLTDVKTGTRPKYRGIYLQRLADPTKAWNPLPPDTNHDPAIPCNPYITVDFASVDLTVFSGDEETNRTVAGVALDLNDPNPFAPGIPNELFRTRERGGDVGGSGNPYNLFSAFTQTPAATAAAANADPEMYFKYRLEHTLGYLNTTFGTPLQSGATVGNSTVPPEAAGAPTTPFPWFTWLDRPFANPYELLLVPSSSPSRLFYEYVGTGLTGSPSTAAQHPVIPNTGVSPYLNIISSPPPANANNWRAPYAHLFNFFHGSIPGIPGADLSRLFDLIETPSPFVNSHRWYNPVVAETATVMPAWPSILDGFRPPHNRLSRFRDPGRININTIYDQRVWNGICDLFPNLQGQWSDLITSRQGYVGSGADPRYPSRFNNPFRAALASDLMPNTGYNLRDPSSGAQIATPANLRVASSEATLLRTDPTVAGPNPAPLFDNNADTMLTERHAPRNPFFRYQGLGRLSNLVTNHSNVFAVRMTIGYFELEPWVHPVTGALIRDDAHPEGVAIGQEVGSDTGNVKRERAFFIIDRSIPVGFEPDENHNVDKAVLVRRYIN